MENINLENLTPETFSKLTKEQILALLEKQQKEIKELKQQKTKNSSTRRITRQEKASFKSHVLQKIQNDNMFFEIYYLVQVIVGETTIDNPLFELAANTSSLEDWKLESMEAMVRQISLSGGSINSPKLKSLLTNNSKDNDSDDDNDDNTETPTSN